MTFLLIFIAGLAGGFLGALGVGFLWYLDITSPVDEWMDE